MHFLFTTAVLAATCLAAPAVVGKRELCTTQGEYRCSPSGTSIEVCDVTNNWILNGACTDTQVCGDISGLPFCLDKATPATPQNPVTVSSSSTATSSPTGTPPPPAGDSGDSGKDVCRAPGAYRCALHIQGIENCSTEGFWEPIGACGTGEICRYNDINDLAYCVNASA